jgi:hypothetical protein
MFLKEKSEFRYLGLQGGDTVCIEPGVYNEYVSLNNNSVGTQVVPITYDVSVNGNRVTFPSGTDLSSVLTDGGDYVYVYRSKFSNNGAFSITAKGTDYVEVSESFISESGAVGDDTKLSATVIRPINYTNCNPGGGQVEITQGFYVENSKYNIFDNLILRDGEGFNLQGGSAFNLIQNNQTQNTSNSGVLVNISSSADPLIYNIIYNNTIYNPAGEGIYIGAGSQGVANNNSNYTSIIDNEIYTSGGSYTIENAVDLKEYNKSTVVEGNYFHDINLATIGNASLDVRQEHDNVLIYNNIWKNVKSNGDNQRSLIKTYPDIQGLEIFNNIFYNDSTDTSETTAFYMESGGIADISFYNNTIHNIDNGLLVNNSGGTYRIYNNIFSGVDNSYVTEWDDTGNVELKNNLFTSNPNWTPGGNGSEVGRIISSNVAFVDELNGDFDLQNTSDAVDAGTADLYSSLDYGFVARDSNPDIGAFETIVPASNQPPTANNDSASTDEDTSVNVDVLANDTDTDGNLDPATVTITTQPSNGSVVVNPDGTVTYTPNTGYFGSDSFAYTVDDEDGDTSNVATVDITVIEVVSNQAPVISDDSSVTTPKDTIIMIDVLSNDSDLDGNLDFSTLEVVQDTPNGTLTIVNNQIQYEPNGTFVGTDTFTYRVCDTDGLCGTAMVTIEITDTADDSNPTDPEDDDSNEDVLPPLVRSGGINEDNFYVFYFIFVLIAVLSGLYFIKRNYLSDKE